MQPVPTITDKLLRIDEMDSIRLLFDDEIAGHRIVGFVVREMHYSAYVQTDFTVDPEELGRHVDVHGGLTYADAGGWYGYDCGHAFDLCLDEDGEPLENTFSIPTSSVIEWYPRKVRDHTEQLALQLAALAESISDEPD